MDALDTFAAERDSLLTVWADLLRPEVADALGGEWDAVLALAQEAYDDVLDAEGGAPGGWGAHARELRSTLAKTTEPHDEAQVDRISLWLATYLVNAATLDAAPAGATKTWVTMRDDDVRELHVPLHGETLAVAERFSVGTADLRFPGEPVGPPEGWINCVAPSTKVGWAGQGVLAITRHVTHGRSVHLRLIDGRDLTVTPNHPVLTPGGYVKADLLRPGDEVMAAPVTVGPQVADVEPSAEQLFSAMSKVGAVERVGVAAVDFHGDVPDEEVQVVWADGDLAAQLRVQGGDQALVRLGVREVTFSDASLLDLARGEGVALAASSGAARGMGGGGVGAALLGRHAGHAQPVGLAGTAGFQPEPTQVDVDGASLDAEFPRHLEDALALGMAATQVVGVERGEGRHEWYNLHTDRNWYSANGIVTHNCRCVISIKEAAMTAAVPEAPMLDDEMWHDDAVRVEPLECHGVLAPEGIPSGDGRMFSVDALSWRDLPIPLMYQPANLPGHDGSVVVGQISRIWREGPLVRWAGRFADTAAADEVAGLIGEEHLRGISVDVDSAELAVDGAEGDNPLTEFSKGRISAATICAIPAFAEAYIALGPGPVDVEDQGAPSFQGEPPVVEDALVASESADEFKRGPGWITDPAPTARIHHYWTKGEGAAKIRWGTPGDFTRCTRQLRKYVGPQYLNRTCAQWHHDALGYWPGQKGMPGNPPFTGETVEAECDDCETTALVASVTLTRDARPVLDGAWFTDPGLTGPTPVTVTEDGRVFGHLATWGTCHIGIQDACVTPPQSKAAYGYFRTGVVLTTDGEVPVGSLTMDTGHAPLSYRARPAAAHYDNTGAVVADVAVGEDAYGIWVAGAMRPNLDADQVARFRASALSGDWRAIAGNLELVGALAVNVPGYPIPRPALAASAADGQTALVAAGVVTPDQHRMRVAALLTEQKKMRAEALLTEMGV